MTSRPRHRHFANSEEPSRLSSVRLACRYGRMSTDKERPRPKIVPRGQVEEVARGWLLLAEQMEWIEGRRSSLLERHDQGKS